jgi:hypothetical protein
MFRVRIQKAELTGDTIASEIFSCACHQCRLGLVLSYFFRRLCRTVAPVWEAERLRVCNWSILRFSTMTHHCINGADSARVLVLVATTFDIMDGRRILEGMFL